MFHLSPTERDAADLSLDRLRTAFVADVTADDPGRREYVDVHLDELDLSALVLDGPDVGSITFRDVTIDGTLDLSGAVVRHPVVFEDARIGQLETTNGTFELDVTIGGSVLGTPGESANCLRTRRASFERSVHVSDTQLAGSVEFAACDVQGWLDVDHVAVTGPAHFSNLTVGTVQFIDTTFAVGAEFTGATGDQAIFQGVQLANSDDGTDAEGDDGSNGQKGGDGSNGQEGGDDNNGDEGDDDSTSTADVLDFSEGAFGLLRVQPDTDIVCHLVGATVSAGRLDQPADAVARYELTDAVLGDVDLDCDGASFDRYRFYRTRFDGFPFAAYRAVLRTNRWRLHEYVGTPVENTSTEGLEHTYLEAKQGASEMGDSETASMFFVRELRYRRQRYAAHARATEHTPAHRGEAALRWVTNGFLDLIAGYGERPQRTLVLSLAVILGSALAYPATGGLVTGPDVVTYASDGVAAALDGLYFSVVTFATLGLGDVHPAGDVGRFIAASEGLTGAFLTAVFVFSLGRRVTR